MTHIFIFKKNNNIKLIIIEAYKNTKINLIEYFTKLKYIFAFAFETQKS